MRPLRHSLLATALIAVVALTSLQLGAARGQARVAGEVVLCTGAGPVTLAVDADGQPVGAPHFCPDCALTLLLALADATVSPARPVHRRAAPIRTDPVIAVAAAPLRQRARAPPTLF